MFHVCFFAFALYGLLLILSDKYFIFILILCYLYEFSYIFTRNIHIFLQVFKNIYTYHYYFKSLYVLILIFGSSMGLFQLTIFLFVTVGHIVL